MKTYKIKNYKGNLVESISKFQEMYKDMKILEAREIDESLVIKVEEAQNGIEEFKNFKKYMKIAIDIRPGGADSYYGPHGDIKSYRMALDQAAESLIKITCINKNKADVDAAYKMLGSLSGSCGAYAIPRALVVKCWKQAMKDRSLKLTPYASTIFARFKF